MNDANQVRINELARELEVKAKAIIDLLPGYGVTEKKTHSSSIPVDVAEKVRKKLAGGDDEPAAEAPKPAAAKPAAPSAPPAATPAAPPRPASSSTIPAAAPVAPRPTTPAVAPSTAPSAGTTSGAAPTVAPATSPRPPAPAPVATIPGISAASPASAPVGAAPGTAPAAPRLVAATPAAAPSAPSSVPLRPGVPPARPAAPGSASAPQCADFRAPELRKLPCVPVRLRQEIFQHVPGVPPAARPGTQPVGTRPAAAAPWRRRSASRRTRKAAASCWQSRTFAHGKPRTSSRHDSGQPASQRPASRPANATAFRRRRRRHWPQLLAASHQWTRWCAESSF